MCHGASVPVLRWQDPLALDAVAKDPVTRDRHVIDTAELWDVASWGQVTWTQLVPPSLTSFQVFLFYNGWLIMMVNCLTQFAKCFCDRFDQLCTCETTRSVSQDHRCGSNHCRPCATNSGGISQLGTRQVESSSPHA